MNKSIYSIKSKIIKTTLLIILSLSLISHLNAQQPKSDTINYEDSPFGIWDTKTGFGIEEPDITSMTDLEIHWEAAPVPPLSASKWREWDSLYHYYINTGITPVPLIDLIHDGLKFYDGRPIHRTVYNLTDYYNFIKAAVTNIGDGNINHWMLGVEIDNLYNRGEITVEQYTLSLVSGVEKIFWVTTYEFNWNDNPDHYFSKVGLIYNGIGNDDPGLGVKKLACYTYKKMIEILEGSSWVSITEIPVPEDNVYAYMFLKGEKPIWVVWWDYWNEPSLNSKTVCLFAGDYDSVTITEAVPNAENGLEINSEDYPDFFLKETNKVINDTLHLTLEQSPVFIEAVSPFTSIKSTTDNKNYQNFYLNQNYPNPFNPETTMRYQINRPSEVEITIYNIKGQKVKTLVNQFREAGEHLLVWNGKDDFDRNVNSGVYLFKMQAGKYKVQKRMTLLR